MGGKCGPRGPQGPRGRPGENGEVGQDGRDGDNGPRGQAQTIGHVFAKHSQSASGCNCPAGTRKLWHGYSLLHTVGNDLHHVQDLGRSGSCVRHFNHLPTTSCEVGGTCRTANKQEKSYWLSTNEPLPPTSVSGRNIKKYVSTCSVCEAKSTTFAVHSQTNEVPACPNGYRSLWLGYSFLQHNSDGADGGGQDLMSPGSCLQNFRSTPFIECTGQSGNCQYFSNSLSCWMRTIAEQNQFSNPMSSYSGRNLEKNISRCNVCMRDV